MIGMKIKSVLRETHSWFYWFTRKLKGRYCGLGASIAIPDSQFWRLGHERQ